MHFSGRFRNYVEWTYALLEIHDSTFDPSIREGKQLLPALSEGGQKGLHSSCPCLLKSPAELNIAGMDHALNSILRWNRP